MNPTNTRIVFLHALLLTLVLGGAGCGTTKPKPVAWTIKINKPPGIEVDLVGVTAREKPRLKAYSVDKYWLPGDLERKNASKLTSPPQTGTWVIDIKDPVWKQWLGRNVTGCFVIANLPGTFAASEESRREFISFDKKIWPEAKRHTLEIEIQENKIDVITPEIHSEEP